MGTMVHEHTSVLCYVYVTCLVLRWWWWWYNHNNYTGTN